MAERKGQNEERRKKADGTIYDDVLRTIQERHGELLIPVVNDAFGMHYRKNEKVTRLPEEYQKVLSKVIADSCSLIGNHVYHMEVQSSEDGEMALRMVEYDFVIGLSMAEKSEEELVIPLPRSCVIYLRHTGRTPEAERICVRFQDGQTVRYLVPVIKVQEYTVDELFEKELYAYLPFYLMRYEKELRKIEQNDRYASELASECGRLLERLELALYDNPGTFQDLLRLMRRVTQHLLSGRERLMREVGEVMGGKVLELPTDKLREERETGRAEGRAEGRMEGRAEGRTEGRAEGRAEGDVFRLISQVRKKMLRRKPFGEICKELEEEAKHIRPICEAFLRKGLDCPEEEIYKEL